MQGSLARTTREDVFLFVVTRLWKMNSLLFIVYLLLAFFATVQSLNTIFFFDF